MIRDLRLTPPPHLWPLRTRFDDPSPCLGRTLGQWITRTRKQLLGNDSDRPIAATGHQAEFFHPGVLAKYHALDAPGDRGADLLELIVDQDDNDPLELPAPMIDDAGRPVAGTLRLAPPGRAGIATGSRPALSPQTPPLETLWPDAQPRARILLDSMRKFADSENLAVQIALAAADLRGLSVASHDDDGIYRLNAATGSPALRTLMTTSALTRTEAWERLCAHTAASSQEMREAYNRAVAAHPDAGIRPLTDSEIPLWIVEADTPRRPAHEADLRRDRAHLRPRALLMTAFMRLFLCDLFIHGTGGYLYDRITEEWIRNWLGLELAPMTCATATVTLNGSGPHVTDADLHRAQWRLHHLPYNLDEELDDNAERRWKQDLLARIDAAPRRSPQRRELFDALRARQQHLQEQHRDRLDAARLDLERTEEALAAQRVLGARNWPFPLHDPADLRDLAGRVHAAFSESPLAAPR